MFTNRIRTQITNTIGRILCRMDKHIWVDGKDPDKLDCQRQGCEAGQAELGSESTFPPYTWVLFPDKTSRDQALTRNREEIARGEIRP